ncbi:PilZ domain-containing protein [Novosphingobium sp. TH158]|uniref:PilZ domain-containing protein n=1 Tax=Novosphingobium sp. TH158 TaxID=2067455 RepID=UPI000C7A7A70|nr:PilZ domain-containing protein [Novosphingobium sp. TH158]PLK25689.1 hypothetical protein C0V78_01370 [Novosphingobium sp. TH158]
MATRATATRGKSASSRAFVERKAARSKVRAIASITSVDGKREGARLRDISTLGCAIRSEADWVRTGGIVSISLGRGKPVDGIVRWTRDGAAGIEFLRPLTRDRQDWMDQIAMQDEW